MSHFPLLRWLPPQFSNISESPSVTETGGDVWKLKQKQSFVSHYISKHLVTSSNDLSKNESGFETNEKKDIYYYFSLNNHFLLNSLYLGQKRLPTSVLLIQI